eukprot:367508-Karenia_brevis.AAC.1
MASYALAMGSRVYFRWMPSEFNHADGSSRRWEQRRIEEEAINREPGLFSNEDFPACDNAQSKLLDNFGGSVQQSTPH